MNHFSRFSITSLMVVSSAVFASEPAEGWYAGLMLGISYAPSIKSTVHVTSPFFTTSLPAKLTYKVLGNFAGQVGFRCRKFRYEVELDFNTNKFSKLTVGALSLSSKKDIFGLSMKGSTSTVSGILNAFYEFYDEDYSETKFVPYVGLGIGYAHVENKLNLYHDGTKLMNTTHTKSSNAPLAQAILGISYFFTNNISLGTDLRYLSTNNIKDFHSRVSFGSWNLIMNFSFDQP